MNHFAAKKGSVKNPFKGIIALSPMTLHPDYVPPEYRDLYRSYAEYSVDVPVVDAATMRTYYGK